MSLYASPMALVALAQAGDNHLVRTLQAVFDGHCALAACRSAWGMVKAEIFSGPLSAAAGAGFPMVSRPPMPEPRNTPQRQGFLSVVDARISNGINAADEK